MIPTPGIVGSVRALLLPSSTNAAPTSVNVSVLFAMRMNGDACPSASRGSVKLTVSVDAAGSSASRRRVTVVLVRSSTGPVMFSVLPAPSVRASTSAVNEPPLILTTGPAVVVK